MKITNDPYQILDILGGAPSDDYEQDVKFSEEHYKVTFSEVSYNLALSYLEQP